jgi:hypothetical protein
MGGIIEYLASACKPTNETQAQVSMNEQAKLLIRHLFVCLMVVNATFNRSYGIWIYNYLCNQCLSPLML